MATNAQKLASTIRDRYNGGQPDPQSRISLTAAELLVEQIAAGVRLERWEANYLRLGIQQTNGQFVKKYTIALEAGGTGYKVAPLPFSVVAIPNNRGFSYVFEQGTLRAIEIIDKGTLGNLAGGILRKTGRYFACPEADYIEIYGECDANTPKLTGIDVGAIVPDASQVDEASDFIIMERAFATLRGQPYPDMDVNANPQ